MTHFDARSISTEVGERGTETRTLQAMCAQANAARRTGLTLADAGKRRQPQVLRLVERLVAMR